MPDLIVPVPDLKYEALAPGLAAQEKPVEVRLAPVRFPDGSLLTGKDLLAAGFLTYRQFIAGAPVEVWASGRKEWRPEASIQPGDLQAQALAFKEEDSLPWQGLLVALGQKDLADNDQFTRQVGGFPRYNFRARFIGKLAGQEIAGVSTPSAWLSFGSMVDQNRAGIAIEPDGKPKEATLVQLFLRNAAFQRIGSVEIRTSGSSAEVEIANFAVGGTRLARVRLLATGEIRLEPLSGQKVVIIGDLETERITYQTAGGVKVTLP
jgi:hypothetical protein